MKTEELETLKKQWQREQDGLKSKIIEDSFTLDFKINFKDEDNINIEGLKYIAGVDISFFKEEPNRAIASLAILSYPELEMKYLETSDILLKQPYIAGYLAFREVEPLLELIKQAEIKVPNMKIQVIFVDGNGKLHPNQFGLACHLGVLSGYPTIGVGKNMLYLDAEDNLSKNNFKLKDFVKIKNHFYSLIIGESKIIYGAALVKQVDSKNPIFISQGHRISLSDCIYLVSLCSVFKIPEPIRQADLQSRFTVKKICEK